MISEEMLDIFAQFDGDIDGFARCATAAERRVLDDQAWYRISELLQEWTLATSGYAGSAFKDSAEARMLAESSTPRVTERMKALACTVDCITLRRSDG